MDGNTSGSARLCQCDQQVAATKWKLTADLLRLLRQRHQAASHVPGQGSAQGLNPLSKSTRDQPTETVFIQHRNLIGSQLNSHPVHFIPWLEGVSNFGGSGIGPESRWERGLFGGDTTQPLAGIFITQRVRFSHTKQLGVALVGFPEPFPEASSAHHMIGKLSVIKRVSAGISSQQVPLSAPGFHFPQTQDQLTIGHQEVLSSGKSLFHQSVLYEQLTRQSGISWREGHTTATIQLQT